MHQELLSLLRCPDCGGNLRLDDVAPARKTIQEGSLVCGGCAGRYVSLGARVVAVDSSLAVEACFENLGGHPALDVVQADVYRLPFAPESFDLVYCLGVLQHTPDVKKAFMALPRQLKPGGQLAVDLYPKLLLNWLWPKHWLRVITRWLPARYLHAAVSWVFPMLYPASLALGRVPRLGKKLRYVVPVVNYEGVLPLSASQLREWGLLDTFDMLGPRYDQPQKLGTLRSWFEEAALEDVWVSRLGFLVGRGSKPISGSGSRCTSRS